MGIALVVVTMRSGSEEFSNTHAVASNGGYTTPIDEGELNSIGANQIFTSSSTNPLESEDYRGLDFLLHAIVGFQRLLAGPWVEFLRLYVTDGRRNDEGSTVFFTTNLEGFGVRDVGLADNLVAAPGNVVLQVTRTPIGLSNRSGRLQLRGVLLDSEVQFGGNRLVDFQSPTVALNIGALVLDARTTSGLALYLSGGAQAVEGQEYALPHYGPPDSPTANQLMSVTPVRLLTASSVRGRQVSKGKRESPVVGAMRREIAELRRRTEQSDADLAAVRAYQEGFKAGVRSIGPSD